MSTSGTIDRLGGSEPARISLEQWPIERLVPSARNARTHSDAQVAEIAGSIRAFGFINPILAGDDGDVVAGHGRLAAARLLGLTQVPVIPLHGLTETQRRQLMLADNRIALNAGWDAEMLNLELQELSVMGADLEALGFTARELAAALNQGGEGLTGENEVPEAAETAVTVAGDVWCLGAHRVICGDSTDATGVKTLLGDIVPGLMVTDPPYGVEYDPECEINAGLATPHAPARCTTMSAPTGPRCGRPSPAPSPTCGMAHFARSRWRKAWCVKASPSGRRSSGPRKDWSSGAVIIIGSTNPVGTRCAPKATGLAIASKRRCGPFRVAGKMRTPFTARRSRSNACAGRCSQFQSRPGHLRAVPWERHDADRITNIGPGLLRD